MHYVINASAPPTLCNIFTNMSSIHSQNTHSAASNNFYIKWSRLEIHRNSFSRIGAKLWNEIPPVLWENYWFHTKKGIESVQLSIFEEVDSVHWYTPIISKVKSSVRRVSFDAKTDYCLQGKIYQRLVSWQLPVVAFKLLTGWYLFTPVG